MHWTENNQNLDGTVRTVTRYYQILLGKIRQKESMKQTLLHQKRGRHWTVQT